MRSGDEENAYIVYTNTSRDEPVGHRYKDAAAMNRLKELKRHWDLDGCFTHELLKAKGSDILSV